MYGIPIELDKPRTLRYNRFVLKIVKEHEKKGLARMFTDPGVDVTWALLWAGLLDEDPSLTYEKAGELMEQYIKTVDIDEKIIEALKLGGWVKSKEDPETSSGGTSM